MTVTAGKKVFLSMDMLRAALWALFIFNSTTEARKQKTKKKPDEVVAETDEEADDRPTECYYCVHSRRKKDLEDGVSNTI